VLRTVWLRTIRLAFWALYNPLAWAYDGVSWVVSLGLWRDWQRAALDEVRGNCVLELAFGTGNLLLDLHNAGYRPIGLDQSAGMAHIAQRKLRQAARPVSLVQGRAQQIPFAEASFDTVLCAFPAEFIVQPDTFREIARVLSPSGRAVVVVMAHLQTTTLGRRLIEWLYRITGQREPLPDLRPHLAELGLSYRTTCKSVSGSSVVVAIVNKASA
jgi:ubiquinone/menaquinone biosynthesis C-methylase UbiE